MSDNGGQSPRRWELDLECRLLMEGSPLWWLYHAGWRGSEEEGRRILKEAR